MSDLLEQLFDPNAGALSPADRKRAMARLKSKKTGHAWQIGSGPTGETCKSCRHYTIKQMGGSYRKCGLMRQHWTSGPGTDIKASDPACKKWEKSE